jgi:hypothetical protein
MPSGPDSAAVRPPAWLLLVYQLPSRPSNARVKTWRRLQKLGARAIRNSAYVLPNSPQAREDFEWLKAEIAALKGQGDVFAADTLDPQSSDELVAEFRRARQQEFEAIRREATLMLGRSGQGRSPADSRRPWMARAVRTLRERWTEVVAVDFFGAPRRDEAAAALDQLERMLAGSGPRAGIRATEGDILMAEKFRECIWVTRPRPGIDRMGSGWLIRRFIDPRARFRFGEKPEKSAATVPFDMFGVEFSHQGNRCTFETLTRRFAISSPAVNWLAQIVHDLDLKDDRYALPEASAIGRLVDGLRQMYADDSELLERGIAMFEALYRSYEDHRQGAGKSAVRSRRRAKRIPA